MGLRAQAIADVTLINESLSLVLSDQAERSLEAVELTQIDFLEQMRSAGVHTADDLRRLMSSEAVHLALHDRVPGLPQLAGIVITDDHFDVINSSISWPQPKANAAQHEFALAMRENPAIDRLPGSLSYTALTGKLTLYVTRTIRGDDGAFVGNIMGLVKLDFFDRLYKDVALKAGVNIALFRDDGRLLARYPPAPELIGKAFPRSSILLAVRASDTQKATVQTMGDLNKQELVIAGQSLRNFPVVVGVATTLKAALSFWRGQSIGIVSIVTCLETLIAVCVAMQLRQNLGHRRVMETMAAARAAERQVVDGARALQSLVAAMPGAFVRTMPNADGTWRITYAAPTIEAMFGYPLEALLLPQAFALLMAPDVLGRLRAALHLTLDAGGVSGDFTIRHRNGSLLVCQALLSRNITEAGEAEVIALWTDVTRERALSRQLEQAAKLALLGEVATGMAHELNQPLAAISMAAENAIAAVRRSGMDVPKLQPRLDRIVELVTRASSIIDHMRVFGRTGHGPVETVALATVLDHTEVLLRGKLRDGSVLLRIDQPADLPDLRAKTIPLEQVVINVIANACDAYVDNSVAIEQRVVCVRAWVEAGLVAISISDRAGGIPAEHLQSVFRPFFTTKSAGNGTGLGLSISYGIITDMGGTLVAENSDAGAIFTIRLPIAGAEMGNHEGVA